MRGCEVWKKAGPLLEKCMQAVATVYLLIVGCMVPLYMYDGYYLLGTAKFQLYRNVSFAVLPLMVFFAVVKAAGKGVFPGRRCGKTFGKMSGKNSGKSSAPNSVGKSEEKHRGREMLRDWLPELFLLGYGAAVIVSFCLSSYKKEGVYGADGWYMGLFSQLSFLALYFYYSFVWEGEKEAVGIVLGVSGGICLLAVLNRFGVWPLEFRGRSETTLSTIGNVNWLCGYLSVLLPLGTGVFWGSRRDGSRGGKWRQFGAGFFTAEAFLCTAVQGSDSGFLIIGAALCTLFLISCRDTAGMCAFWDVFLTAAGAVFAGLMGLSAVRETVWPEGGGAGNFGLYAAGAFLVIAIGGRFWWRRYGGTAGREEVCRRLSGMRKGFVLLLAGAAAVCGLLLAAGTLGGAGLKSLPSVFVFSEDWGNGRGGIWKECMQIWLEQGMGRKLFGVGPDCLKAFLYTEQSGRPLLAQTFAQVVLTNCHNEWMTVLMNTGLFGLIAYAGFMVSAAARFLRRSGAFAAAGALVVITYTVHNMVSFQQITSTPLLFLVIGIALNGGCIKQENKVK